jgi:hypothetical protein
MSFLNNLDQFGEGLDKPSASLATPPRERFESSGASTIREIESGAAEGNWFKKVGDAYEVTLRNGIAVLKVGGKHKRRCPDATSAVAYVRAAMAAAATGELDEMLAATQLKFKSRVQA